MAEDNLPETNLPGQEIDWEAESVLVQLAVELPFWLFLADCGINLRYAQRIWRVEVSSNWVELHSREVRDSKFGGVVFVGPAKEVGKGLVPRWTALRKAKTVVLMESPLNSWITRQLDSPLIDLPAVVRKYLVAWCLGHLAVLNALIRSYRLCTYDYHAHEVSARDVPIWYVKNKGLATTVCVYPYSQWDYRPTLRNGPDAEAVEMHFTDGEKVGRKALEAAPPEELELMDALGLMERGDYSSAVRRMRTSLEVLVSNKLQAFLTQKYDSAYAEQFMNRTRNDFMQRWNKLKALMPADSLHSDADEVIRKLNDLRRQIVHNGKRLTFDERGIAQEVVDRGRWLYNSIEADPERFRVREERIAARSLGRVFPVFHTVLGPQGVTVEGFQSQRSCT